MTEYFWTGPAEYEYEWIENELEINETISVSSSNGGDNHVLSEYYDIPDYPTGTDYTNEFLFTFRYSYVCTGYSPQNRYSVNEIWNVSGPLIYAIDNDPCFVKYRYRGPYTWSESNSVDFTSSYPYVGSCRWKVDAQTEYGLGGSASTSLTIISLVAARKKKTTKTQTPTTYGYWNVRSIDYTVGDVEIIEEGVVNYIAVSK